MEERSTTETIGGITVHTIQQTERKPFNLSDALLHFQTAKLIGDNLWSAVCPNCKKDMAIIFNPGGAQKLIFRCVSRCTAEQICSAVGLSLVDITQETGQGNKSNISIVPASAATPKVKNDITTFTKIIDERFPIRYNEMSQRTEMFDNAIGDYGCWKDFTDEDKAVITQYCQDVYGISHKSNLENAILVCQRKHSVNPLITLLNSLVWDGKPRTRQFLRDVMKCEPEYITEEISQMIFTGGIRRAFEPGCKWDNVVVLVGSQGSGKTTIVDLLGLGYTSQIRTFSGKDAIESIGGIWIGEIGELAAVRKAKDIEEIKSFITTQIDIYRKAYGHYVVRLPRRCIFIGTTNSKAFLSDTSGNRRFFPITVHSDGKKIWKNIDDIKNYVRQCWAEAVHDYKNGKLPKDYDHSIDQELNRSRLVFSDEDWKIGAMETYLEKKKEGEKVCCLELWVYACGLEKEKLSGSRTESNHICSYLDNHPDWERLPERPRFTIKGESIQQRAWIKRKRFPGAT